MRDSAAGRLPISGRWLLVGAAVFLVVGFWLTVHNPDSGIRREWAGGTSEASTTCLAPYDTVLNGASNTPGGEISATDDAIAARCRALGRTRYRQGIVVMALGACCAGAAGISVLRRRLR